MKKGSSWCLRQGIGVLAAVVASLGLATTAVGASAVGVTHQPGLHAASHQPPSAVHSTRHLHGTVNSKLTVKPFSPPQSTFQLVPTTTLETCQNSKVAPANTTLPKGKFSEYTAPNGANGDEGKMLNGADGAMWYGSNANAIVRVSSKGEFTVCPLPTNTDYVNFLTNGPDGAVWFTEFDNNKIGRVQIVSKSPATDIASFTEFSNPEGPLYITAPEGITLGSDNHLWFTEYYGNKVDKMTVSGLVVSYTLPTGCSQPGAITLGPDHALWFTETNNARIGRITTQGYLTEYDGDISEPLDIVTGSDHKLWFTDYGNKAIGRMDTDGTLTEFGDLYGDTAPEYITTLGDNKSLVFTQDSGLITRIKTNGTMTQIGIPNEYWIYGIAASSDNTVWFLQDDEPTVGKFVFKS